MSNITVPQLKRALRNNGIVGYSKLRKAELMNLFNTIDEDAVKAPSLVNLTVTQLKQIAKDYGVNGYSRMRKPQLIQIFKKIQKGENLAGRRRLA
jgi:hypothetical protein